MSLWKYLIVMAVAFTANSARAEAPAACVAGSFASVAGSSCTIGNLVFTFGETHVVDQTGQVSIYSLKFVPLPAASGFAIVGKFVDTFSSSEAWISGFGVATLNGASTISGITVKDYATTTTPYDIHFAELSLIDAANANNTVQVSTGYSYPVSCRNPYSCSGSFAAGPVSAAYDPYYAILEGAIPSSGTVTSYASAFLIDETATAAAVPEPAGIALMAAGLAMLGVGGSRRRAS